jgi:glycosyltransferase involved in cell wall biosynthesis
MKICQVAPLYESVPPKCYGGTERVVSYLTEELVRQGHDVTLFASGDSVTQAKLIPARPRALRLDETCIDQLAYHIRLVELVAQQTASFDVVHYHIDYLHYPVSRRSRTPHVTTLHGRLDIPELVPLYHEFRDVPVVSISDSQREPLKWINWQATIYHGLPKDLYDYHDAPGKYLAFVGRISPEKGVDRAIELARRTGQPLKIAAKVDAVDREYFQNTIEPLLQDPLVEFIGEIGEEEKNEFLENAQAFVFLVDWPEPFGLAMIEAMACGTPVIAFRRGSIPEVIDQGESGFVVEDLDEAVQAVESIETLSRRRCRELFERRFSVSRMAHDYVKVYRKLLEGGALDSAA